METPVEKLVRFKEGIESIMLQKRMNRGATDNPEAYLETAVEELVHNIDLIKKSFKDQVIVDLGAGEHEFGYLISCLAEAKSYIGVEPFNADMLRLSLLNASSQSFNVSDRAKLSCIFDSQVLEYLQAKESDGSINCIPYAVAQTDMLTFAKSLKDDSVSMIASGIDHCIISDRTYKNQVQREIQRVLSPEGALLSIQSNVYIPTDGKRHDLNGMRGGSTYRQGSSLVGANALLKK